MTPRIGQIDPVLKIRIDNLQNQIDMVDEKYGLESRYFYAGLEIRMELVKLRAKLINKIA